MRIISLLTSFAIVLGTFAILPEITGGEVNAAVTAEAASGTSDLVIKATQKSNFEDITSGTYSNNKRITSLTFPKQKKTFDKSYWELEANSFANCTSLKKVVFEGDRALIRGNAFKNCTALEEVVFKGEYVSIWGGAFNGCDNIKKIVFECPYIAIGEDAFKEFPNLEEISIASAGGFIGESAFAGCPKLKNVTISQTGQTFKDDNQTYDTIEIWYAAFANCPKLKSVTITPSVTYCVNQRGYADSFDSTVKVVKKKYSNGLPAPVVKAQSSDKRVTLSWNAVDGADMYRVYQYNPSTDKYEKINDGKKTKYMVTNLKGKTEYKFKVVAMKKSGKNYTPGESSKIVSVTTK